MEFDANGGRERLAEAGPAGGPVFSLHVSQARSPGKETNGAVSALLCLAEGNSLDCARTLFFVCPGRH